MVIDLKQIRQAQAQRIGQGQFRPGYPPSPGAPKGSPFPPQGAPGTGVPGMPGWYTVPIAGQQRGPPLPAGMFWLYNATGERRTWIPRPVPGRPV